MFIEASSGNPVRVVTSLLAEMQTTINAAGLRMFDGDIDRFGLFSLVVREGLAGEGSRMAISTHSISSSLGRPFETIRRHINALVAAGYCERRKGGVIVSVATAQRPEIESLLALSHDAFVRFVEGLSAAGMLPASAPSSRAYRSDIGVLAAVDILLATTETNRNMHRDWLDLVLFSTVLYGNLQRFERDAAGGHPSAHLDSRHAVRATAVARLLNLSETTTRRRLAAIVAHGGQLVQARQGLLVSEAWLASPAAAETSAATFRHVRRVLAKVAASGFPFDAIPTAYVRGRPPAIVFE